MQTNSNIVNVIWNLSARFGTLAISLLSNVILARLLSPNDFGCIGILMVFLMLANTILDGGLGAALIQKKEPNNIDYSTVFTFNIVVSFLLYLILVIVSPYIAEYYKIPILSDILRVQGIILFINALRIIQYNILIKTLQFKKLAVYEVSTSLIGTVVGIVMAFTGYGVWSLVFNNLVASLFFTIIINLTTKWRPSFYFNRESFKSLFSFGGMILLSNLVDTLYKNVNSLIIGKAFNATQLGYYTQATKLESIPVTGLTSAINSVFFPVFSKLQDDRVKLGEHLSKCISLLSYMSFPIMVAVILVASPIFDFVFTPKWHQSIPYFQLLCIAGMITPLNMMNMNIIRSVGAGKKYFYMQIFQFAAGLVAILVGMQYGIEGIIIGNIVVAYIYYIIVVNINSKLLNMTVLSQIRNILGNYLLAIFVGIVVYPIYMYINIISTVLIFNIITTFTIYMIIYLLLSYILKVRGFKNFRTYIIKK